jgi:LuxR family glucitol operon transcriptional activator
MLIVIDGIDAVPDSTGILSFISDLPSTARVLITTREEDFYHCLRLGTLSERESVILAASLAKERGVELSSESASSLLQATGGVPLAIAYAVGLLALHYPIEIILEEIARPDGDMTRYCFGHVRDRLAESVAYKLVMALALFPSEVSRDDLIPTAGLEADRVASAKALATLQRLSLVNERDGRLSMLPLTRAYALAELSAHPAFEAEARKRLESWKVRRRASL